MIRARFEWKIEDFWVGAFWRQSVPTWMAVGGTGLLEADRVDVWVCLLPCLPLHIVWEGEPRPHDLSANAMEAEG